MTEEEKTLSADAVLYESSDGIATITLNRPEKLNALNDAIWEGLEAALVTANRDDAVHVAVLRGAGRAFSAGYDVSPEGAFGEKVAGIRSAMDWWRGFELLLHRHMLVWNSAKPVIAQVHGYAISGADGLALACDFCLMDDDAQLGVPGVRAEGMPIHMMYPYLLNPQLTKRLVLTGDLIDGREAERMGLIYRSYRPDELEAATYSLAQRLSMIPIELLTVNKSAANRAYEIMGLIAAQRACADLDAIVHVIPSVMEFNRIAKEQGVAAAIRWRDAKFQ